VVMGLGADEVSFCSLEWLGRVMVGG
jgi:hypothetical protein